jgi:uncharacterized membrane protein
VIEGNSKMNFSILKNRLSSPWPALILITLTAVVIYSNIYQAPFVFDEERPLKTN